MVAPNVTHLIPLQQKPILAWPHLGVDSSMPAQCTPQAPAVSLSTFFLMPQEPAGLLSKCHPGRQRSEHPSGATPQPMGDGSQWITVPAFHLFGRQLERSQGSRAPNPTLASLLMLLTSNSRTSLLGSTSIIQLHLTATVIV